MVILDSCARLGRIAFLFLTLASAAACTSGNRCGDGTREEHGVCVAAAATLNPTPQGPPLDAAPPPPDADPTPAEDGLVKVWEKELTSFGYSRSDDNVKASEAGDLTIAKFKRKGNRRYLAPSLDLFGEPDGKSWTLVITRVGVDKGDTDTFPYVGTVAWTLTPPVLSPLDRPRSGTTDYQYSAKAQQWRRR